MKLFVVQAEVPSRSAESIYILKMMDEMLEQGIPTRLLCPSREKNSDLSVYRLRNKVEIKRTIWPSVKGKVFINAFFSLIAIFFMGSKSKKEVYTRSIECAYFISFFYKTVLDLHSPQYEVGQIQRKMFASMINNGRLDRIVVLTEALKNYIKKDFDNRNINIVVAPDAAEINLAESSNITLPEGVNVGYTGHLYKGKGIGLICEVAKISKDINFHIIGGTEKDINYWKEKTSTMKNMFFHGYVEYRNVGDYLSSLDILLLPNQKEVHTHGGKTDIGQWTSPMKAFEYMAAKKPIVVSDIPILKEVFTDKENCIICDPEIPEQWATAIETIAENRCISEKISNNAYNDFYSKYNWASRVRLIFNDTL